MEIPEVGCGACFQQRVQYLIGPVAVLGSCPQIQTVSDTPTGCIVATLGKSYLRSIKPGGSVGIDYVTGIKTDELRDMSVLGIVGNGGVIILLTELLDLSRKTDDYRIVLVKLLHNALEYAKLLGIKDVRIGQVYAKLFCGEQSVKVVLISKGLCVCRSDGIIPYAVYVHFG